MVQCQLFFRSGYIIPCHRLLWPHLIRGSIGKVQSGYWWWSVKHQAILLGPFPISKRRKYIIMRIGSLAVLLPSSVSTRVDEERSLPMLEFDIALLINDGPLSHTRLLRIDLSSSYLASCAYPVLVRTFEMIESGFACVSLRHMPLGSQAWGYGVEMFSVSWHSHRNRYHARWLPGRIDSVRRRRKLRHSCHVRGPRESIQFRRSRGERRSSWEWWDRF